jgi:hypothetical protein
LTAISATITTCAMPCRVLRCGAFNLRGMVVEHDRLRTQGFAGVGQQEFGVGIGVGHVQRVGRIGRGHEVGVRRHAQGAQAGGFWRRRRLRRKDLWGVSRNAECL